METDRCDAQAFLEFLRYILSQYEYQHIVMILDNARIHHAKLLQPFLKENEDSDLVVLAPVFSQFKCSGTNLGVAKKSVIANRFHANRKDIRKSVLSFLEHLHEYPEKVIRLIGSMAMSEI